MSDPTTALAQLVCVNAGFKPSVQLPADFENEAINVQLIENYIPTSQTMALFIEIARSLQSNNTERVRSLVGTYGTGKSDLLLMICNYFARSADDPVMASFYAKLRNINEAQYNIIYQSRANKAPFLVVLLQPDPMTQFPGFSIYGLEQALARKSLSHLMASTKYTAARTQIEAWQRDNPALLEQFVKRLRDVEGKELAALLAELNSPQADHALAKFTRAFRAVTSTDFNVYAYGQPNQIYETVARQLNGAGYAGLLLVCDEFTEFLRRFEHAIDQQNREVDSETLAVQNLAETSERSSAAQLHFIVASLEGFASASASSSSGQASKAIERLGGRFRSHALMTQDSEELIRGALQKTPASKGLTLIPNPQQDDLLAIAEQLYRPQGKSRQWIKDVVIQGAFPLHPLTTFALPLINQRVAQSQRTMFLFLNDSQGLKGFLTNETLGSSYPNWNNLLTLDRLYDYFAESIAVRRSDISDAYAHALHVVKNATVDTALAERVLKILVLSEVIAPQLATTRTLLRHALNLPSSAEGELITALDMLDQLDAVVPPNDDGGAYTLSMVGRVSSSSLRRRISARAQQLSTSVQRLHSAHPPEAVLAAEYNQRRGTQRQLTAFYTGLSELASSTRLKSDLDQARDGVLWYVVASSETERGEALAQARELTRQHNRLIVAVPTKQLDVLNRLREYEALCDVRIDATLDGSAREYLKDNGRIGRGYREAFDKSLAAMRDISQWEWFRAGFPQPNISGRSQAQALASKLMTEVFSATPEHQLSQHIKADGRKNHLNDAATEILKGEVHVNKSGKGPVDVLLRKGAVDLGLLKLEKIEGGFEVFQIVEPDGNYNSKKIWQLIHDRLRAGKWASIIPELRKPPYGLYDSHLLLFLAALLTKHADEIEIRNVNSPSQRALTLDVELLEKLIVQPRTYAITLQPLTETERRWLRGIVNSATGRVFETSGGRGSTLRDRVVEQLRGWIKRQQLPLFAETLDAAQLEQFLPEVGAEIRTAIPMLLAANRNDSTLAPALLGELPTALGAPVDRSAWTSETVDTLLASYTVVCRTIEHLPALLETHATRRMAAIFGAEQYDAESAWNAIYQWRANRRVIETTDRQGYQRYLLMYTNNPTGSIRAAFLEEFARSIVGLNLPYQQWSSLDALDRLEQEVRKAYEEIERRWKERAPKEDVWRDGVARAALGRPASNITAEAVSKALVDWAAAISWPACAAKLNHTDLSRLYPDLSTSTCAGIAHILQRTDYTADNWRDELIDVLPKLFGIGNWLSKQEIDEAVKCFDTALRHAQSLDAVLRRHTLERLAALFAGVPTAAPIADIVVDWRAAHPIPPQNDLSEEATLLLNQLGDSTVVETTLLTTLPRALPGIEQAAQQWPNYAALDRYIGAVERTVREINTYVPLTSAEHRWLTGIVTQAFHQPLTTDAHEQSKLVQIVRSQLSAWLRELRLPPFSATLSESDLHALHPDADATTIGVMRLLLRAQVDETPAATFLLVTLPAALGNSTTSQVWSDEDVDVLLATLSVVCRRILELNSVLTRTLYADIGAVFGIKMNGGGPNVLLGKLRGWRESHVLFKGEKLSSEADLVFRSLATNDEPDDVLLNKLPKRLGETRAPYTSWRSWDERQAYLDALRAAAQEIEHLGHIGDATPRVRTLWATLQQQIDELSPDERRWLIKAFDEAYRV